eukprot:6465527-Amphidinium_carterae.1
MSTPTWCRWNHSQDTSLVTSIAVTFRLMAKGCADDTSIGQFSLARATCGVLNPMVSPAPSSTQLQKLLSNHAHPTLNACNVALDTLLGRMSNSTKKTLKAAISTEVCTCACVCARVIVGWLIIAADDLFILHSAPVRAGEVNARDIDLSSLHVPKLASRNIGLWKDSSQ